MENVDSLYSKIMKIIKQKIISGEYPINSKLQNEFELSKQFNVSRVTLRRAIAGLVEDGWVKKVRGVGTFVCKPQKVKRMVKSSAVESFSKTAFNEGFNAKAKIIQIKQVDTPNKLKKVLQDKQTLFIERIHLIDDEPVMLEKNYFPLPRFKALENEDLTKSLYDILYKKYKIKKLTEIDTIISVSLATLDEAKYLKKSVGFPLLLLNVAVGDEHKKIVHAGKQYIISDRYEFHI